MSLSAAGIPVRCLARHPQNLASKIKPGITVVQGDLSDEKSLHAALEGVHTAYYLVHSMQEGDRFEALERAAAENFARAAKAQRVQRIVYLGGLGDSEQALSQHLRSRQEVGRILRGFGGVCIELRASIVIGSGSLSFEMVRALVERLPIMITPRWVRVLAQPISIEDLIQVLLKCLTLPQATSVVYEIGGPDRVSYGEIMNEYARQRGLKRFMIPVPFLTPHLSGLWLGLVTPVYARIGRTLVKSIQHATIVRDNAMERVFGIRAKTLTESIRRALVNEDADIAQTRWCDAISSGGIKPVWGGARLGTRLIDIRSATTSLPVERAFKPIQCIGGDNGWYYGTFLWKWRGALDLLVGGVGMRRGRRHPSEIAMGDPLDFWRVENYVPNKLLLLRAEMKVPGRAWLQFEATEEPAGTRLTQTAIFDASGIQGLMYWYALYPVHQLIFRNMLKQIQRRGTDLIFQQQR